MVPRGWQDNASWVHGRHGLKFGGEYTGSVLPEELIVLPEELIVRD